MLYLQKKIGIQSVPRGKPFLMKCMGENKNSRIFLILNEYSYSKKKIVYITIIKPNNRITFSYIFDEVILKRLVSRLLSVVHVLSEKAKLENVFNNSWDGMRVTHRRFFFVTQTRTRPKPIIYYR